MVSKILSRAILIAFLALITPDFPLAKNKSKQHLTSAKKAILPRDKHLTRNISAPSKSIAYQGNKTYNPPKCSNCDVQNRFIKILGGISDAVGTLSDHDKRKFKPAPVAIAALGVKLHRKFTAHVSVAYRPKHKYSYKGPGYDFPEQHSISDISFSVNGNFIIYSGEFFEPYITSGAGIAFNKSGDFTSGKLRTDGVFPLGPPYKEVLLGKVNQSFVWRVGLGSEIKISKKLRIDIAYLYSDLGKYTTSNTIHKVGAPEADTEYIIKPPRHGKQRTHNILAGIAYWF